MKATTSPQSKGSRHPKNGSIKKNGSTNGSPTPTSPKFKQNGDNLSPIEQRNSPLAKKQKLFTKILQLEKRLEELQSSTAPEFYSDNQSTTELNEMLERNTLEIMELKKQLLETQKEQLEAERMLAINNNQVKQLEYQRQLMQLEQNSPSPQLNPNLSISNPNDAVVSIKTNETENQKSSPKKKSVKSKKNKELEQIQQTQQLQKLQELQEIQQKQQQRINELQKQQQNQEKKVPVSDQSINESSFAAMNPVQAKKYAEKHFKNQETKKSSKSSGSEKPVIKERGIDLEEPKDNSINVNVIELGGIPTSAPYCVIYTESKTNPPIKTKVLHNGGIFDENYNITFNSSLPKSSVLVILVKNEDLIKGDKLIGFVRIDLNVALKKIESNHKELDKWFPIMTESRVKTQSKIHIILRNSNSLNTKESSVSVPQNYSSESQKSANKKKESPKGTRLAKPTPIVDVNLCSPRPNPTSPKYQKSSDSTPTKNESKPKPYKRISPTKNESSQKQESLNNSSNAPAPAALSDQNNEKVVSRSVSLSEASSKNEEANPPKSPNKLQQQVGSLLSGFKPTNEPLADILSEPDQNEESVKSEDEPAQVCVLAPSKCPIPVVKKPDPNGNEFASLSLQEIIQRTGTPRILERDIQLEEFEEEEEEQFEVGQLELANDTEENIEKKLEKAFGARVPDNIEEKLNGGEKKGSSVVYNLANIAKYYQPRIQDDDGKVQTREVSLVNEKPKPRIMKIENVSDETDSSVFDLTKHIENDENIEAEKTESEKFISKLYEEEEDKNDNEPLPQINKKFVPKSESDEDDNESSYNKNSINQSNNDFNDSDSDSLQIFSYTQDHSTIKLELSPTIVSPSKQFGSTFYEKDDIVNDDNDGLDDTHEQRNNANDDNNGLNDKHEEANNANDDKNVIDTNEQTNNANDDNDKNVIDTPSRKRKKHRHHSKSKKSETNNNEEQAADVDIEIDIDGKSAV